MLPSPASGHRGRILRASHSRSDHDRSPGPQQRDSHRSRWTSWSSTPLRPGTVPGVLTR